MKLFIRNSEVQGYKMRKPIIGMLAGMGLGQVIAWLVNANMILGLGMGMLVGVTCGYCIEGSQPKRSRILLGVFTLTLLTPILFLRFR